MHKTHMALVLGTILSTIEIAAYAMHAGPPPMLTITNGVQTYDPNGNPANVIGSWFAFDLSADMRIQGSEKIPLSQGWDGGLILGWPQSPGWIDSGVDFFGARTLHFTNTPVRGGATTGGSGGLDFRGWALAWGDSTLSLGGGAWQPANCNSLGCGGHTFTDGNAMLSWDGIYGHPYKLFYTATSWNSGPLAGIPYSVHLQGIMLPVPGAVWLLGSGLIGLAAFMRPRGGRA